MISVCVPVFNGGSFLLEALESIEAQTYQNFELLISDDGSTDDSVTLIKSFVLSSKVKKIYTYSNQSLGIANNCNFLVSKASGKYIKFLFQDDILEPFALETFIINLNGSSDTSLVFSDRHLIYKLGSSGNCHDVFNGCSDLANNWTKIRSWQPGKNLLEDKRLLFDPINKIGEPSNTLIARDSFTKSGGFDPQFCQLLDVDLWFRLMKFGSVIYIDKKLSKFRIHESQQSVLNAKDNLIGDDFLKLYHKLITSNDFSDMSEGFRSRVLDAYKPLMAKSLKSQEINEYLTRIEHLTKRVSFMEETYFWKLRKLLMKFHYLFFPKKNKIKKPKFYSPLTFATFGRINLQNHQNPKVSIIIPFFQQHSTTWLCLKALELNADYYLNFEVILVDDCSENNSDFENSIKGIKVLKNKKNLGFLKSCNNGALIAKGEYLIFLNNDTQIQKEWMYSLIMVLENDSNAGAVGSKLIYPDNKLQEAGGIIWNDATGCNYGKNDQHTLPEYNFLREVDYCSGASLAISKSLFFELDMFEKDYSPAYFEDTDLCFKIRRRGRKVIYQPRSIVIHLEGTSCGKSEEIGVKSYQKKNRVRFLENWSFELPKHFLPSGGSELKYRAANRLSGKNTILVIDSSLPYYDKESGGHRLFQILKILKSLHFHIVFLPANEILDQPYFSLLSDLGIEVLVDECGRYNSEDLLIQRASNIDIAWICRPQMFKRFYHLIKKYSNATFIYDTIDLHYLRLKREWMLDGGKCSKLEKKWKKFKKEEKLFSKKANLALTVTRNEANIVKSWKGENVFVLPNIHTQRFSEIPSFSAREGVLFIGSYLHPPNVDAAKFLINVIMPKVWNQHPNINVTLLGSNPGTDIINLSSEKVLVTGFVQDVNPYFDKAKVFVSPLRFGAGMKGKVGQSLSLGLPVVTTTVGAEGMNLKHKYNALITDDAFEIAKSIKSLLLDPKLWAHLSSNGICAMNRYSPENVAVEIKKILKNII